ncbi:MAG: Rad3-related DNA helicase [Dehalococcoidia bacterium]|nr:Rad3-related DNA helicase [Dehalococcoidia bacterium]
MKVSQDFSEFLRGFNSQKFKELWPPQAYVLGKYSEEFKDKPDVAIELPTGAGKTLISLLIAETWRSAGKKVAILSANKTLARQMLAETRELGIPAVLMEGKAEQIPSKDKRDYQRAGKIAVMNYWVYFNQNPVVDPADLLVLDDAHLAEHCLHSLWSVEISRFEHKDLFKALVTELVNRFPEYVVLQDALSDETPPTTAPELLSFIDQVNVASRLKEIIDASSLLKTNMDLKFRWSRMRNSLNESNIYLSLDSIWIRPYVYPLLNNDHYSGASQRLYMSATIGQPSDLCRRLGTKRIEKIPVPEEFSQATVGRRLIVMNRIEDDDIPTRLQAAILAALKKCPKSVWMCTSRVQAEKFRTMVSEWLSKNGVTGDQTWLLSNLGDEIDQFKVAKNGHLFVGGRFDGMDFQGDQCRLVVIATLPRAINAQEEFLCEYLRDSGFMRRRLNQRIVQALGRCNRAPDDYAVYILADRRFATHFGRESNREGISRNVVAEIDMAEEMAEIDVSDLERKVEDFLSGSFSEHDQSVKQMLASVPVTANTPDFPDVAEDEVVAWAAMFSSQNYGVAAEKFKACWEWARGAGLVELGAYYGWCWAKALYLKSLLGDTAAKEQAFQIFEQAIARGGISSWFNRMRASLNRARGQAITSVAVDVEEYLQSIVRAFDKKLEELGTRGNRFENWCNKLTVDLDSKRHKEYVCGLKIFGELLGYDSSSPKNNSATDCQWRGIFGNLKEVFTYEAKIEDNPSAKVTASDIGQAHNQIARAKKEYENLGYVIRGSIVTHLGELMPDAESSAGEIRVIQKQAVQELWKCVKQLLSEYRASWSLDDINTRRRAFIPIRPKLPPSGWLLRALDSDLRILTTKVVLKEWKL